MKLYFSAVGIVLLLALSLFSCKDPEIIWGDNDSPGNGNTSNNVLVVYSINGSIFSYAPLDEEHKQVKSFGYDLIYTLNISADKTTVLATVKEGTFSYTVYVLNASDGSVIDSKTIQSTEPIKPSCVGFIGNTNEAYFAINSNCTILNAPAGKYNYNYSNLNNPVLFIESFYIKPGSLEAIIYYKANLYDFYKVTVPNKSPAYDPVSVFGSQTYVYNYSKHGFKDKVFVYSRSADNMFSYFEILSDNLDESFSNSQYNYNDFVYYYQNNSSAFTNYFVFNKKVNEYYLLKLNGISNVEFVTPINKSGSISFNDYSNLKIINSFNNVDKFLIDMN